MTQVSKLAAMEAMWKTEPAPASLTLFGFPNEETRTTALGVHIPYVMGIIGTRSFDKVIPGIDQIEATTRSRIENGVFAVKTLEQLRKDPKNPQLLAAFKEKQKDLGYGLLLKKYTADVAQATPAMIDKAVDEAIPAVAPMFWTFRIMVGLSGLMLLLFAATFFFSWRNRLDKPWLLRAALFAIPVPWIACEMGWFVAEYGRQPWTIYGVLPTHLSTSTLSTGSLIFSLCGFMLFYTLLLAAEMFLMFKYSRLGPSSLGTGQYHFEQAVPATPALKES